MAPNQDILVLPISVVSRVDVGRLLREIELVDNFLTQAAIREGGQPVKLPKTSRLMDEIIEVNKLNVLIEPERKRLMAYMLVVHEKAPVLNMSFSADPSPLFIQKLMIWLRREIHPMVLLQTGLQPNIGAGCVLRTTNKYFDFSLREHFIRNRELLIDKLSGTSQ